MSMTDDWVNTEELAETDLLHLLVIPIQRNGRVSSRWRSSRCTKRTASQSYGTSKRAKYSEKKRDLAVCVEFTPGVAPASRRHSVTTLNRDWAGLNAAHAQPTAAAVELKCYMSKFRDAHVENRATNRRGSLLRLYNQRVLCALFYSVTSLTIA
ncbi:unnamed protein product [Trichogramma brassicae]|uniref:Uncharacterized protein n=1 Tax=Trichogramma brassicae TaxID=86971 RepID=A0A6H5HRY1_9HYME|nr:unnamed protein product [Trichogramma brassicae]